MASIIDLRFMKIGTMADLSAANRILKLAQPGFEVDTSRVKIGDGLTRWNDLPYQSTNSLGTGVIDAGEPSSIYTDSPINGGEPS